MVTNRTPLKARRRRLSLDEVDDLICGFPRAFRDETERRKTWQLHRDRLLVHSGRRPDAWWSLEAPRLGVVRPGDSNYEPAALYEAGMLTPFEIEQQMERWRHHFDAAQAPGFAFCNGSGWLRGEEAKRTLFRWAGIPRALLAQWIADAAV